VVTDQKTLAIVVTIGFSLVGILGDYFLKLASASDKSLTTKWFYIGFVLYASTAFGWVFVMKQLKLATIGVVYSISMVVLLTAIGVIFFQESLNYYEVAGLILAVVSLILLVRFA
jgi:small multidrug resistance pump